MERKQIILAIAIIILSLGGIMAISGCDNKATAPSDYTITVPPEGDFTVPAGASNYRVYFPDYIVQVKDADGNPKQGISIKMLWHGNGFGSFCTSIDMGTFTCNNPSSGTYEQETDSSGRILVNYRSAAFTSISTEQTYTFGFRAQSGGVEATHTDTVTVSAIE